MHCCFEGRESFSRRERQGGCGCLHARLAALNSQQITSRKLLGAIGVPTRSVRLAAASGARRSLGGAPPLACTPALQLQQLVRGDGSQFQGELKPGAQFWVSTAALADAEQKYAAHRPSSLPILSILDLGRCGTHDWRAELSFERWWSR